jgi:hypothetical protein
MKIIVGILLFMAIFAGLAFAYSKLTDTPIKMPDMEGMKLKIKSLKS